MAKATAWILFWLFVAIGWAGLFIISLSRGWASCEVTRSCLSDRIEGNLTLLLLPAQAALAAYIRTRYK